MPLDTRIPLGTQLPQVRSPLQTLGALGQIREHQLQVEDRQLQMEARRRALEDDAFTRQALQESGGNPDTAIDALYRTGRVSAAGALSKQVFERRKAVGEQLKMDLDNDKASITFAAQILGSVKGEQDYHAATRAIRALRPNDQNWQGLVGQLGETYDPNRVKQAVAWGMTVKEQIDQQQKAVDNAFKAWELQLKVLEEGRAREQSRVEVRNLYQESASQMLSTAQNQEQWDTFQRLLADGGVPVDILAAFGNRYSPAAAQRARELGMSQAEKETARHNRTTEAQRNREIGIRQQEADQNPQRDITRRSSMDRRATAERWRAAQIKAIEDAGYAEDEAVQRRRDVEQSFRAQIGDPTPEESERWKRADFDALEADQSLDAAKKAARKLQIEDEYRQRGGRPSLLEEEDQLARAGRAADLAKVRKVYKDLTGEDTPLTRMESLNQKIRAEKDPTTKAALLRELAALRAKYREQAGR